MRLTRQLRFEEIMNFTHPSMFAIVPKDQLVTMYTQLYDNNQMKINIDSTSVSGVSADFKSGGTTYRQVDYRLKLTVLYKDSASLNDSSFVNNLTTNLRQGFPGGTVRFNKAKSSFYISTGNNIMFAIKDNEQTPWMFLGY